MNITDALEPFFAGKTSFEEASESAAELFSRCFRSYTYKCEVCERLVFPKITTNEHGIFVEDRRSEIRGGKGNRRIKSNVCEECIQRRMNE